ncbi:hypothetical protein K469DRAFT_709321 [Zopfia rhizophila CBS 207.26]|uniref:DUF6594 domain-containing protein n=1 Tax=Zopfia rhizophila CBS 207.26 TaxID=1314779 RepID=A0A6A6ERR8_9PEZI|nr:hypothetical protein K469DRAFT_709321 [Zopfia rhizophila CBS 207.26]
MTSNDPLRDRIMGYPKLAAQIEIRPETAMFRRFGALNAENLLYYQAELVQLEKLLRECQLADSLSSKGRKSKYALNWYWLRESRADGDTRQLDLVLRIRETLRLYNEALIQQCQILTYPEPDQWDLTYMQNFLQTKEMGPFALNGPDATIWGSATERKKYSPDLVTLCPRPKEDPFSGWVVEKAITNLFRCGCARFKKPSRVHGVIGYEDATILKITYWITSILASLIPIASIIILYCVHSMPARLGIIGGFNVLISICLSAFTNAKRSEVFAVTAAFAAVQVVFVSTDRDCSPRNASV